MYVCSNTYITYTKIIHCQQYRIAYTLVNFHSIVKYNPSVFNSYSLLVMCQVKMLILKHFYHVPIHGKTHNFNSDLPNPERLPKSE